MDIQKSDIDGLTAQLKISLTKDDYLPEYEKALKEQRKKISAPGFRPGNYPMGLVKKQYGKYILAEELNKMVSQKLSDYFKDNNLEILGDPMPSENQQPLDFDKQEEFEFCFDIAPSPEVNISVSEKNKFNLYKIKVEDDLIDKQIEQYKNRYGSRISVESVEGSEVLRGDFNQVDDSGSIVSEGVSKTNGSILLSNLKDKDSVNLFIGKKNKDEIIFNPLKAVENETEVASMLAISKDEKEKLKSDYKFTISDIIRFNKAEVNQDLFDKIFGKDIIKSEQEFKDKIKSDIEIRFLENSNYKLFTDVRKKLIELTDITLPENFLKRWLTEINRDKDIKPETIDNEFPLFLEDMKWQLIRNKISKEQNIEITKEEIAEEAKKFARSQFENYGYFNAPEEEISKWAAEILKNKEQINNLVQKIVDEKVIEWVKGNVKIVEKEISLEEFNKMFEK